MKRDIYDEDHEAFREMVKEFVRRYVTNEKREQWDRDGEVDRATAANNVWEPRVYGWTDIGPA